ncbi:MAG: hypothetical protein ACE5HC_10800 [Candidatus Binatia bacterium]
MGLIAFKTAASESLCMYLAPANNKQKFSFSTEHALVYRGTDPHARNLAVNKSIREGPCACLRNTNHSGVCTSQ